METPEMRRESEGKGGQKRGRWQDASISMSSGWMWAREGESYEGIGVGDHLRSEIWVQLIEFLGQSESGEGEVEEEDG